MNTDEALTRLERLGFENIVISLKAFDVPMMIRAYRLASETFAFLKSVLLKARPSTPFRGPPFIQGNKFTYIDLSDGDLSQFHGHERIFYRGEVVFRQDYVGGLVVPKDPKAVSVK